MTKVRQQLDVGFATHVGARKRNEDSVGARTCDDVLVAGVADGLGGMHRGDAASRTAIGALLADVSAADLADLHDPERQSSWLHERAWTANDLVSDALDGQPGGTTLTAVAFVGNRFTLTHVGDTRAYVLTDGQLRLLTNDHSVVAEMVKNGEITEDEAMHSSRRNEILRCLGALDEREDGYIEELLDGPLGTESAVLAPGSVVLIASDGVWATVPPVRLCELAASDATAQEIADAIISAALELRTADNASVCVVAHHPEASDTDATGDDWLGGLDGLDGSELDDGATVVAGNRATAGSVSFAPNLAVDPPVTSPAHGDPTLSNPTFGDMAITGANLSGESDRADGRNGDGFEEFDEFDEFDEALVGYGAPEGRSGDAPEQTIEPLCDATDTQPARDRYTYDDPPTREPSEPEPTPISLLERIRSWIRRWS